MHNEINEPFHNVVGQLRIPKADEIRRHIAQYGSNSDFERDARHRVISNIEDKLKISGNSVPAHDRNEINVTTLLIDAKRLDLAAELWSDPKLFMESHEAFFSAGVNCAESMLGIIENRKEHETKWKEMLENL